MTESFGGWGPELVEFFEGLERENTRAWFDNHRALYQRAVRRPTELFAAELSPHYGPAKIFRLARDARFSAGQAPYHTNVAVEFGGDDVHYYVSVTAHELTASVGVFRPDRDWVARYREAVAGAAGEPLPRIVSDLEGRGFRIGGEALKSAPRGYPADHPRSRLLRHRGITASKRSPLADWLADPGVAAHVVDIWEQAAELADWLRKNVRIGGS